MGAQDHGEQESWDDDLFSRFLERLGPEDLEPAGAGADLPAAGGSSEAATPPSAQLIERLGEERTVASRYRILEHVASGGMGAVYKVWDEDLRRSLAMKVALVGEHDRPIGGQAADSQSLGRFLEEAQVTSQLDHPGIVPVHELGRDEQGRVFFTMRLVRGQHLGEVFSLVREGREGWSMTRALGVLLRVCEAVSYAHTKGVVHRDLKPANIMVGRFGAVYVMDWGLARVKGREDRRDLRPTPDLHQTSIVRSVRAQERDLDPSAPLMTMDGSVVGTPVYMPPEQARGDLEEVGERSDVYSLGAILYHLLAGAMPYLPPGAKASAHTVLHWVISGPPKPLAQVAANLPQELVAICEKAMSRESADRYASVAELSDDLRAYLEGRVVAAHQTGALAEARKWVQRNRAAAAASAGLALALGIGAVLTTFLWLGKTRSEEELLRARPAVDLNLLERLEREADGLWPLDPALAGSLADWLERARDVGSRLGGHREALERSLALGERSGLSEDERRRRDLLEVVIERLEGLLAPERGLLDGTGPPFGLGIARRLDLVERLPADTVSGEEAARAWAEAIASIADPARCPLYRGLSIEPQLGLVPLGRDPRSTLWEFHHVASGAAPGRDPESGGLIVSAETGLVFVLIPPGSFTMGSQSDDPEGPAYEPEAVPEIFAARESPPRSCAVAPFFLSKFEMSQGQWLALEGTNPSLLGPGALRGGIRHDLSHPVEQVSWEDGSRALTRLGLCLPTEVQWEYACRAGTQGAWWTGNDSADLAGVANLADATALAAGAEDGVREGRAPFADGYVAHAPVDAFAPNPFGLHSTHGNVYEWCRCPFIGSYQPRAGDWSRGDGAREGEGDGRRVLRGGCYYSDLVHARAAFRIGQAPDARVPIVGLRPARALD
ncbi:MAG: bifunctional serine/threonine-protein kinase/formylglycine-generating enzyme family protein [Planctomycetota bacterium]|jgi:formylglycine-generating enzyme required for sulfatase activity|nr:bifunctional serine/threonine-protein kinase/formylglycine-generating enzyme family protein [Planctomycetota bacterium]MDP6988309.1 bifunctional serine/threonine-protein kinase/formylglycine-generating enzyme family protein [Planctomycetota bacterium]